MKYFRKPVLFLILLSLAQSLWAARKDEEPRAVPIREIQSGIMSFSDTWAAGMFQSSVAMTERLPPDADSLSVQQFRHTSTIAAYEIAAGRYPGVGMLDMMVMVSLNRLAWENHWVRLYGEAANPVVTVMRAMEERIWDFASAYLTGEQMQAMRELVDEWFAAHPGITGANFIRFSDFGELGRKPSLEEAVKKGGFLSPIRDAAQSAEDIKEMGERAIFLGTRLQGLMFNRLELLNQQILAGEDVQQLLSDLSGFRQSSERYAEIMENLPDDMKEIVDFTMKQVSLERQAALEQVVDGLNQERLAAIQQMLDGVAVERQATLEQTLEGLQQERIGVIKAVAHIFFWLELEVRALVIRMFIVFAGLIVLWFGMRLIYRYWVDRVANNFLKTLGVAILFLLMTVPVLLLGNYLIRLAEPDFAQKAAYDAELQSIIEEVHGTD